MGLCKDMMTQPFPRQYPKFTLKGAHPDWEMHPAWITGIEALNAYNFWVCEIMMPIAFQWIEEHHDEVYAHVDEQHKADMGVVMAAAFDLVKELPSYKRWTQAYESFSSEVSAGNFDSSQTNPVWTRITKKIRKDIEEAYGEEAAYLKDTTRT